MGDNNWKKLIGLVLALIKKYKRAKKELDKFKAEFEEQKSTMSKEHTAEWEQIALDCKAGRAADVKVMDAYDVQLPNITSRADVHAQLILKEPSTQRGITSWISYGIKLEEER
jgi:hypothetical protein